MWQHFGGWRRGELTVLSSASVISMIVEEVLRVRSSENCANQFSLDVG
jgi:hypothetical protein